MKRKRILWLCSWYPSEATPFNGDFIQRHARAASLYNDIDVIHVSGTIDQSKTSFFLTSEKGLTETIILYKNRKGLIGKILHHITWSKLYKKAIEKYIKEKGKPDLVHVHIPVKAGLIALWIKRKFSIPYIVTEHWGIYNKVLKENYSAKPSWFKRLTRTVFLNATKLLSVSNYLAAEIRNMISTDLNFTIINNTVNADLFFYKTKHQEKFRFIHISNMISLKNVEGILFAFKELQNIKKNAELVIVGENYFSIKQLAADLGLLNNSVFLKGEIAYSQVANEIQQSDCLVLFSNIENSPCVISEALCCGVPVIATNVGGIPELVSNDNSILVEPGNTEKLKEAMIKMMETYSSFNKYKIAEDAQGKFSYPIIGKEFDLLYRSDMSEKLSGSIQES